MKFEEWNVTLYREVLTIVSKFLQVKNFCWYTLVNGGFVERGLMSVCLFEYVKVVKFMSVNGLVLCLELKRILKPEQ